MPEISQSKYLTSAGWDDIPHLDEKTKRELLESVPPHLRDARSKGIPSLGQGAIYPIKPEEIMCDPFAIPDHWYRGYGMDVGWKVTAAIWGALDKDTDTLYLTAEHYRKEAEPSIHAASIKARGVWIPGAIDPASRGRSQTDGSQLFQLYMNLGLKLILADNAVEAGIYDVYERLSTGRLKVFKTLQNWLGEYRLYRRDEKGKIVKANDHAMDATRYLCRPSSIRQMKQKPAMAKPMHGLSTGRGDKVAGY